jgi:DNA mismatch repair protein MSH5
MVAPRHQSVYVCPSTSSALQVFRAEAHPSAFKEADTKEGLSLWAVLNRTKTAPGAALLRAWLRTPTRDLATLLPRQAAVSFFAQPAHRDLAADLARALSGAGHIHVRALPAA